MTRIHALVITLAVAFAVAAGAFAAFRTTRLGTTSTAHVSPVVLAAQTRKLDRSESALHRALAKRLPPLPKVPKVRKPKVPSGTPPPVVHVVHVATPPPTTTPRAAPTTPSPTTTVSRVAAPTGTTPTTAARPQRHERETGERNTGDDAHERAATTTTTTNRSGNPVDD